MTGNSALPRWGMGGPTVRACAVPLPTGLAERLAIAADTLGTTRETLLRAVHARVITTLTGDRATVVREASGTVEIVVDDGTWAELVATPGRPTEAAAQTAVDAGDPVGGELIAVELDLLDRAELRVRYREDAVSITQARRIAGYHVSALASLAGDPGAPHHTESLVPQDELRRQVHLFAGPRMPLPDKRVHELVEAVVAEHPDRIAVVHNGESWTYRELNRRANQIAWWLLDNGLRQEDRVAVVADRTLLWAAAVLGIFKAGGSYLPVEPNLPVERIRIMLTQAGCGLVLADETGPELAIVPANRTLRLGIEQGVSRNVDPRIPVTADQLAYVYFTSGSTGQPKGAMCEHAGMVNHLLAKIEDLDVGADEVVAQIAPQCFDISLWQLVSAWLTGGTTAIIGQDVIHDVGAFVDTITELGVTVLQVVPSYLEVLLAHVEATGVALPALRCVSVTGEALKSALVSRWFEHFPHVPLVNAYGLTETSDDTNHAVLRAPLSSGRVPVGQPVRNVRVYLVDEQLRPVPLGAPGEIVFAGVCVGRGYINDPARTNRAYLADPFVLGERMYRSGDFGRWLPDGTLEFLGRRDSQVKIRGFRVEIGEVENKISEVPGVADCAVVVVGGPDGVDRLVGFFSGEPTPDTVRERIGERLPDYMVPTTLHHRDSLPLTANGKIDKKRLQAEAAEQVEQPVADELTGPELRLQRAWCEVLGVAPSYVHRRANFFELGGTSLAAIRLAIKLDRVVTLADVTKTPVLTDLAKVIAEQEQHVRQD
jgi:amino acid adenylation domain-containing protein